MHKSQDTLVQITWPQTCEPRSILARQKVLVADLHNEARFIVQLWPPNSNLYLPYVSLIGNFNAHHSWRE
jgi:hypothetical protein